MMRWPAIRTAGRAAPAMAACRRALLAMVLAALPAQAQQDAPQDAPPDPAMLVADEVFLTADGRLIATGNVEALYDGARLTAQRITYDREADSLAIEGPLRLRDGQDNVVLADSAALDGDLRNGILRGARMVMDQQLQLAASRMDRVGGRFTQLSAVSVTSCRICEDGGAPLWQIRARRIVHDAQERQLYFDGAQFRILDVPVFYLPRLRLPDPTLKRAAGFMVPSTRSTSLLGTGLKMPYFVPLGPHRDVTLTPYLSAETRTLELRYRQAFRTGRIEFNGALTDDTLRPDDTRGYLFGSGEFDLPADFRLTFGIETTTDDAYLKDYDYSDNDRLESDLILSRARRDEYFEAGLRHYESLRAGEDNATQPTISADMLLERRYFPARLGGEARLRLQGHSHYRYSDADGPGRDMARLNADLSWRRYWTLRGGIRAGAQAGVALDMFRVYQDTPFEGGDAAAQPNASVELRWPWIRGGPGGASALIEPVVQLAWSRPRPFDLPNDESSRVEFDEANLISLSRFPAPDRRESGRRLAYGLRWAHRDPSGWSAGLTVGQVVRETAEAAFSRSSGLQGTTSDWLIAGHLRSAGGLALIARGLLDETAHFSKAEARALWSNDRLNLAASYILLVEDPAETRSGAISEWSFEGDYRIGRHWISSAEWRYDLASDRPARAGLGLTYRNECVEIDLSASRRFASSSNVEPSTDFGLTVALKGFSTGGAAGDFRRTCRN